MFQASILNFKLMLRCSKWQSLNYSGINNIMNRGCSKLDHERIRVLFDSDDFLILNKPFDMYIGSPDDKEMVVMEEQRLKDIDILYENDEYVILNKPFDMYIDSNNENEKNTILHHLPKLNLTNIDDLRYCHRLDYSTSGVICLAKNKVADAQAKGCFQNRTAKKYYKAIVRGHMKEEFMNIEYAIGTDTTQLEGNRMSADVPGIDTDTCVKPRRSSTCVLALEKGYYDGEPATVLLMKPYTGRRHQLRVHCKTIGHIILGDYTYSDRTDLLPHRMFLHAFRLHLPLENETIDIETEDPFTTDTEFINKWKSEIILNDFESSNRGIVYEKIDNIAQHVPNIIKSRRSRKKIKN